MTSRVDFRFEPAPDLPGSDRISKHGFSVIRKIVDKFWDVEVEGLENVPRSGPAIIAPNHLAFCDSVFVPAALPRRVWTIGKGEYMDDWKTRHLFPAFGMIPIDRSGGDAALAALDTAARVLDGGHLFMIYPEGTRSRSGLLHRGRTGAARLAARSQAPILPVGHEGTTEIQPVGSTGMKPGKKCTIRIGTPIEADQFGDPADPRVLRRVTDSVMYEIAALSGQDYINQYATRDDTPGHPSCPDTKAKISVPSGRMSASKVQPARGHDVALSLR